LDVSGEITDAKGKRDHAIELGLWALSSSGITEFKGSAEHCWGVFEEGEGKQG
jgi:hypothetical protein